MSYRMATIVETGTIIFHHWDPVQGLTERAITFDSLDELFAQCLEIRPGETVDRVILDGIDHKGDQRRLTLAFQSATVSEPTTE